MGRLINYMSKSVKTTNWLLSLSLSSIFQCSILWTVSSEIKIYKKNTSKIVGPSPLRSQVIRNHDRQKECFQTTFWEEMVCFTKLTPRTPPSVKHGWKATDLLSQMVKRKNYLLNPISPQNFANAFAVNHNLKLEVCLMSNYRIISNYQIIWSSWAFLGHHLGHVWGSGAACISDAVLATFTPKNISSILIWVGKFVYLIPISSNWFRTFHVFFKANCDSPKEC